MTTTTILPIILGFLLVLIIKKFYYSIVNKKIDIDETESNSIGEDYWKERHLKEQKNLIDKIKRKIYKRSQY